MFLFVSFLPSHAFLDFLSLVHVVELWDATFARFFWASFWENQKILEIEESENFIKNCLLVISVIVLVIGGKTFFSEELSKQLEETS